MVCSTSKVMPISLPGGSSNRGAMARILVVDDEKTLLELVSLILKTDGHEVRTASSGSKALEILEHERFDLVLLDVMMPDMDGWEVVREMQERPNLKDTPIAMLTVKSMSPQYFYNEAIEGLVDYINKPFSKKELTDRVGSILEEIGRINSIKESLKISSSEFLAEYEDISKAFRRYENLMKSLEISLSKMDPGSPDFKLVTDALNYGQVLLERIRGKKEAYEKLIEEG